VIDVLATFGPILGHVAGVPVEETLPGVLAIAAVGARLASEWLRRRVGWRSARGQVAARRNGAR
jgi:hypothetical protein